ncbi:hypothetical protein BDQ17DRAFT_1434853 [Cyathus striatus]|nr:hypothetical protein BDQ17DRAFT_1434853 [Cyathus striatus]
MLFTESSASANGAILETDITPTLVTPSQFSAVSFQSATVPSLFEGSISSLPPTAIPAVESRSTYQGVIGGGIGFETALTAGISIFNTISSGTTQYSTESAETSTASLFTGSTIPSETEIAPIQQFFPSQSSTISSQTIASSTESQESLSTIYPSAQSFAESMLRQASNSVLTPTTTSTFTPTTTSTLTAQAKLRVVVLAMRQLRP